MTADAILEFDRLWSRVEKRTPSLFLDFDGTLAPIAANPDAAELPSETERVLRDLSGRMNVAIISGREIHNIISKVGLACIAYAGSHGFQIQLASGQAIEPLSLEIERAQLKALYKDLKKRLGDILTITLEPKVFSLAVHYREVDNDLSVARIFRTVEESIRKYPSLKQMFGKKVIDVRPKADWHKGRAIRKLLELNGQDSSKYLPIYIGDDETDKDALREVQSDGIGIYVGAEIANYPAEFSLSDTEAVCRFLSLINERQKGV